MDMLLVILIIFANMLLPVVINVISTSISYNSQNDLQNQHLMEQQRIFDEQQQFMTRQEMELMCQQDNQLQIQDMQDRHANFNAFGNFDNQVDFSNDFGGFNHFDF